MFSETLLNCSGSLSLLQKNLQLQHHEPKCCSYFLPYPSDSERNSRTTRCTCIKISDRPVNPRSLEKLEVIPASQSCPRVEIIATMKKNGEKRCLNPESKTIKNLLKAISKER
ncbi:hypothetical protein DBR06_SOUSAS12110016 [Sousa chinensis]|nr:hypothetical protein DBR06_SOUSAS12110016 [Sousa chinensis]